MAQSGHFDAGTNSLTTSFARDHSPASNTIPSRESDTLAGDDRHDVDALLFSNDRSRGTKRLFRPGFGRKVQRAISKVQ
jgi:hypothetical protein